VNIGDRIRIARKAAGLSQEEVARRAGLSLKGMGEIERGDIEDPHISSLTRIARALGVSVGTLLKEEEPALAGKAEAPEETGLAEEEGRSLALIRGLRTYFWDLRLRWLEPDHKPSPDQIQDALDLLHHLREAGAFEGSRTPAERFDVQLLNQAAWQLRPIVEELVGPREDAVDLRQKVDDVFAEIEAR
jgi:transcriptional regulator with XRE-family HTH domain